MSLSAWFGWGAFVCLGVAAAVAQFARLNDPDEPLFALYWGRWKHMRRGLPFAFAALALLAAAGIATLVGR